MARPLPMQKLHFLPSSFTFLMVLTAIFSVLSVVTFLCSKAQKTVRLGGGIKREAAVKKVEESRLSSKGKALLLTKFISWKKVQEYGEDDEVEVDGEDNGAVWKKTIIKGEKCRPLDFSGRILYDSKGNLVSD